MSTTQTVETRLGEVTYDTVQCSHCSAEVLPENSISIGLDLKSETCSPDRLCFNERPTPEKQIDMCERCAEMVHDYKPGYANGAHRLVAGRLGMSDRPARHGAMGFFALGSVAWLGVSWVITELVPEPLFGVSVMIWLLAMLAITLVAWVRSLGL